MKQLLDLFVSFFKIGLFTFGGGYAMLPMLQREVVEKHGWVSGDELLDYFAISQCTPGVIAVNTATFVGTKLRGVIGGAVSTIAVVFPSLLIITLISTVLQEFSSYEIVTHAFAGIRVAVCALIVVSVWKLFKKGVKDLLGYLIFGVSLIAVFVFGVSPIWLVLAAALVGCSKAIIQSRKKEDRA